MRRKKIPSEEDRSVTARLLGIEPSTDVQATQQKAWLTGYLLPLGSVLIAALTFLTQNFQLPKWAFILAMSYLVLVAGVSLYDPVCRILSFLLRKGRLRRLAGTSFPVVLDKLKGLRQLVGEQRGDTLVYVIEQAGQWDEIRCQSQVLVEPEHVETIRNWLSSIERRAVRYRRGDFSNLCQELSDLIHRYNRFCCQRLRMLQELTGGDRLPDHKLRHLKQQWNLHREAHVAFVRGWQDLSRVLNEKADARLCIDYYEPLGTLE